jgi:hypothetical protein
MHPVAVIFAILAGGELFGFTGVLLALPVAAVIMVLVRHVQDLYKDSQVYTGQSKTRSCKPGHCVGAGASRGASLCLCAPGGSRSSNKLQSIQDLNANL